LLFTTYGSTAYIHPIAIARADKRNEENCAWIIKLTQKDFDDLGNKTICLADFPDYVFKIHATASLIDHHLHRQAQGQLLAGSPLCSGVCSLTHIDIPVPNQNQTNLEALCALGPARWTREDALQKLHIANQNPDRLPKWRMKENLGLQKYSSWLDLRYNMDNYNYNINIHGQLVPILYAKLIKGLTLED
jgi:hypothetical protein